MMQNNNILLAKGNGIKTNPLKYINLVKLLKESRKVISDSDVIQEENTTFKPPQSIPKEIRETSKEVNFKHKNNK